MNLVVINHWFEQYKIGEEDRMEGKGSDGNNKRNSVKQKGIIVANYLWQKWKPPFTASLTPHCSADPSR